MRHVLTCHRRCTLESSGISSSKGSRKSGWPTLRCRRRWKRSTAKCRRCGMATRLGLGEKGESRQESRRITGTIYVQSLRTAGSVRIQRKYRSRVMLEHEQTNGNAMTFSSGTLKACTVYTTAYYIRCWDVHVSMRATKRYLCAKRGKPSKGYSNSAGQSLERKECDDLYSIYVGRSGNTKRARSQVADSIPAMGWLDQSVVYS